MVTISFRQARSGDADALGAVHVASWRETYAGLLPDPLLASLSAEARAAMWRAVLDDSAANWGMAVFVAESAGEIIGFGACGEQRDATLKAQGYDGEIGAIYVLRSHQQAGAGKALMRLMVHRLVGQGRAAAALWVLRENAAARAFYERLGGIPAGEKADDMGGTRVTEVGYGWRDLSRLTE